ncbi:hypothetical protein GCM10007103_02200 [Salinimicrobium marinum]|uniref:DUF6089 domain-containing protein n=1 Tax=Salinimicrobium marinum TaxID=680283 RepID=A0A918VU81_9FLAO|nr:DUF6089 family protein [Salinimicrobium marinum]GHA24520.1 hypothetical protein GCM10007103_02200 [Salinimicrobium marinum]
MRYNFVMFLMLICGTQAFSQRFEVGPFIGGANYIGDVGNTTYIRPQNPVFGGLVKWNQSTRYAYRFSLLFAEIEADDARSNDTRRQQRGYSFTNNITEASLGVEFTFWDWDLHSRTYQSTPYLYSGLNYYFANHFRLNNGALEKAGNNWEFSIPMVFGYKQTLTNNLAGGIELGARYTFTDNLDGSKPSEIDGNFRSDDFGNPNTTDWYVFTGIYITINFGRKPCYTHF